MAAAETKDPREKLGVGFWVLWAAGFLLLILGYLTLTRWNWSQEHWSNSTHVIGTIVFTVGIWAWALVPYFLRRRRGVGEKLRRPMRRYMARFMPAMLLYVVFLSLALEFYQAQQPEGVLLWLVALVPAIPVLFAIRAIVLVMKEEDDEFQRELHRRAFILATGLMLALSTVWGFLEMFSLVPHVPMWAAFPGWAVCLLPAQIAVRWKWR